MIIPITKDVMESLTKTEMAIVQYINSNEGILTDLSIVDIAEETYSSPSTVSRAIRKCGLNGFNELRHRLTQTTENKELHQLGEILNKSVMEAQILVERISATELLSIAKEILQAKKVYVLSRGPSEFVGEEFCFKLQLLDINAMFINDPDIMRKKAKRMHSDELVFIFSLNGGTPELLDAAQSATACNSKVISCCCNEHSQLFQYSNHYVTGYRHHHIAIKDFEVSSRVSLFMISRIITDYLVGYNSENDTLEY